VLYRRFMLRLAEALAERTGALALVTGDSLGQVSSQTLGNLDTINRAATLPVLRPLIGMDKNEIVERARAIGSYEISIEPDEDCCSYLMPRRPATWTRPEPIEAIEARLDVKGMVDAALARASEERIRPSA
jgi:thiamine biosynthesis protein ThiI